MHEFEAQELEDGIGKSSNEKDSTNQLSSSSTSINRLFKPHDEGCANCNHTGFKGRIGIYEVLHNDEQIQKLIVSNGTSDTIQNQAIGDGMLTMQLDGFIKSLRGETAIAEVLRVTSEE
jgi:type II secretory ATPase GspE/PulE/Tfp pilus assembly ATPase PilB-like protein